jgi:hypothetical protein
MITKILLFVRPSLSFFSTLIAMVVASQSGFSQTNGCYVALLRSECTSAPLSPPAVGQTVVGPDYVMMTVAEGDPLDFSAAQQAVTDATFASLMPQYCGLSRTGGTGCVTNRVQWNVMTYDATGNPKISGCAASGCQYHTCDVTNLHPMLASRIIAAVPTLNNGAVTLTFSSEPGLHYVIEYKATIDVTLWTRLYSIDGTGEVISVRDCGAMSSSRFYRIRVE